jgi:carboxymethylenebutenolidase
VIEKTVEIPTKDGACTTFIVHPDRGGPHPAILFYMDAPAIREELRDMARRLASAGYYVVLPNMYYRAGEMEVGAMDVSPGSAWLTRMFELMYSLTIPLVMEDTASWLAFIEADPAARTDRIGTFGYCMSGQYAINAAARYPDRVAAAASIYGVALVTEADNSPHLAARKAKGELYFACAELDAYAPMEMVRTLETDLKANAVNAELEIYPDTDHGFAFPDRPAFHKLSAERHWARLHALFARNLLRT